MRISIRRCLSMLRNTSDVNELRAAPMPCKEHSVGCWYTVYAGLRYRWVLDTVGVVVLA